MADKVKNYKQMSQELNEIINWFENADVDLDEAIKKYEEAQMLIESMQSYLKNAENKIIKLTKQKPTK